MRRSDFDYELPPGLIAERPLADRTACRLMVLGNGLAARHTSFERLIDELEPGDVLVLNDTRVVKARLIAAKDSGGRAEVLVERFEPDAVTALCQVRVSKPLKPGRTLNLADQEIEVIERVGEFYRLAFPMPVSEFLERFGHTPLPPYIERADDAFDADDYQTVYAAKAGAVAAPTAGLHFDAPLLDAIRSKGIEVHTVTLHVGAGTFQPVRAEDLGAHTMHSERYEVPESTARAVNERRGRVVAVGTTVVRTLETAAATSGEVMAGPGESRLFITPGYRFRVVDALVTNFHLPESTLIMLVAAFAGYDVTMAAYSEAVTERYRFFSYGDAMFCHRDRHD